MADVIDITKRIKERKTREGSFIEGIMDAIDPNGGWRNQVKSKLQKRLEQKGWFFYGNEDFSDPLAGIATVERVSFLEDGTLEREELENGAFEREDLERCPRPSEKSYLKRRIEFYKKSLRKKIYAERILITKAYDPIYGEEIPKESLIFGVYIKKSPTNITR